MGMSGYVMSEQEKLLAKIEALLAEREELVGALEMVRSIIVEGAVVGFNPFHGGNWAERLFRSQGATKATLAKIKESDNG